MIRIAIDAMGGDFGAEPIISGVIEALKEAEFKAVLVGDSNAIKTTHSTTLFKKYRIYRSYRSHLDVRRSHRRTKKEKIARSTKLLSF